MNILAALPAILLPAAIGWLVVNLCDRRHPVLTTLERSAWAIVLGPTLSMLVVFIAASLGWTAFSLSGFLTPLLILLGLLVIAAWWLGCLFPASPHTSHIGSKTADWVRWAILIYAAWTIVKVLAGAYDLIGVPTYWDDSFNNWNMRGKMFYETQQIVLEIPVGNGNIQTAQGVSSYPPSLPLFKTWVSVLRGSWEEPLVNGIQLLWFAGLLAVFYATLRRSLSKLMSVFGTCLLCSLPLVLIHATNPYAEIFVAAHVLLAVTALFNASRTTSETGLRSWMTLFALALGLLLFTKNEATVLYAPILILLAAWVLKSKGTSLKLIISLIALLAVLALPWIAFKWANGLTFGNAKGISTISLGFSKVAAWAIWHHLSHEPNTLLLPLSLIVTLVAARRRAWRMPMVILAVFVLAAAGIQFLLFTFVGALETEAVMQTGLSRGLVQIAPVGMMLVILLSNLLLKKESE